MTSVANLTAYSVVQEMITRVREGFLPLPDARCPGILKDSEEQSLTLLLSTHLITG